MEKEKVREKADEILDKVKKAREVVEQHIKESQRKLFAKLSPILSKSLSKQTTADRYFLAKKFFDLQDSELVRQKLDTYFDGLMMGQITRVMVIERVEEVCGGRMQIIDFLTKWIEALGDEVGK